MRRRPSEAAALHGVTPEARAHMDPVARSRHDRGPVVVAVDGEIGSRNALDWAAAEASARQCPLRIVTAFSWNAGVYASGLVPIVVGDAGARDNAEVIADRAADRAREIDSTLEITTHVYEDSIRSAVLREGRRGALIVLGCRRRGNAIGSFVGTPTWHIVRHAGCPVSVIKLSDEASHGPSAGRVVVGIDDAPDPCALLGFAFRAAQRRGVGLTALRAVGTVRRHELGPAADGRTATELQAVEAKLHVFRATFPEVEVRRRLVTGPAVPALVTESAGAALIVLGSKGRRVRCCFRDQAIGHHVARLAASSVAIVNAG